MPSIFLKKVLDYLVSNSDTRDDRRLNNLMILYKYK